MNGIIKAVLYLVFAGLLAFSVPRALRAYEQTQIEDSPSSNAGSTMMTYGGVGFAAIVCLGLMVAREVANFAGSSVVKVLYNDDAKLATKNAEYEAADAAWRHADYVGCIEQLRAYLKKNPKEIHAALRIAEIYEKDIRSPLAAALELEEILKYKLRPDKWGWTAIRLANLYSGPLNKVDRAVELLREIDARCGNTKAAEKARGRLAQIDGGQTAPAESSSESEG
ncbi:MAG TPA: hypothetical protein VK968_00520 [Roseimicrobium sp.]|nr:hypothetical protein [Roseimicrobium sp.]